MDMSEKDKLELEKRGENPINHHSSAGMLIDWRFSGGSISNSSLGLVSTDAQTPVCRGDIIGASSCSSASMVDSFGPGLWDYPNSQNLGFCDINVQNQATTSKPLGHRKGGPVSLRNGFDHKAMDMGWNPPSSMLKGGIFFPSAPGMFPQNLSQFPADSAFIECAARFSCFNGGNFSDMVNPFGLPEPMGLFPRSGGLMQGPREVFAAGGLQSISGSQGHKNVTNLAGQLANEGSPLKNDRISDGLVRSHDEAKQGVNGSGNESEEAEFNGGGQDDPSMLNANAGETSAKSLGSKRRKRNGQDTELNLPKGNHQTVEAANNSPEVQQKAAQHPTSGSNKATGKQGSETSEPKEEYIHVRARRGQATNNHSLAERVRREKISERMKFLQDLVPGCSKVTGKAVMLDEIINYVQSLQRQVEFLSMKLATVNPRLDLNIESVLAKDILHSRTMPSSSLAFSPDMPMAYPQFSISQPGLIQSSFPGMDNNSDVLRRAITSQLTSLTGGFKEPTQLPNAWDDELHNVIQMGYGTSRPQEGQDINRPFPPGQMKAEL